MVSTALIETLLHTASILTNITRLTIVVGAALCWTLGRGGGGSVGLAAVADAHTVYGTVSIGAALDQVDVAGSVISAVNIVWPITHRTLRVHISAVKIQKAIWTNARDLTLCTLVQAGAIWATLPELAAI